MKYLYLIVIFITSIPLQCLSKDNSPEDIVRRFLAIEINSPLGLLTDAHEIDKQKIYVSAEIYNLYQAAIVKTQKCFDVANGEKPYMFEDNLVTLAYEHISEVYVYPSETTGDKATVKVMSMHISENFPKVDRFRNSIQILNFELSVENDLWVITDIVHNEEVSMKSFLIDFSKIAELECRT